MLVLGSYGFSSPETRQKLDKIITDKTGKMLIIPIATMFGKETGEKEKYFASLLGFNKADIIVFDEENPDEIKNQQFRYIVVLGGNTFQLLYKVKKFNLDTFIKNQIKNGADYLGFSAGAYLACPNIEYVKNFDDNNHIDNGDFSALGLTDKYVLCHFDMRGLAEIQMCRKFIGDEVELITIDNNQFVVL